MSFVSLLLPLAAIADGAKVNWPDCYCTDRTGARIELGETTCLTVDGRSYLARCEMMLNNPMWREISASCTISKRQPTAPAPATDGAPEIANG
jgi:hypothetical protein